MVRNPFGVVYVLVLSALLAALVRFGSARIARFGLVFLAIQLSLSVFSRSDYLFTCEARTGVGNMPGDASQIAEALLLPYWVWGGLLSLLVLAIGGVALSTADAGLRASVVRLNDTSGLQRPSSRYFGAPSLPLSPRRRGARARFRDSPIRRRRASTSSTSTCKRSPTLTTWVGSFTKRLSSSETCTRPS